ncbi:MAG: hypothetical protein IPH53_14665 [Flavobacteriales bacterium]|nr:hypothetical protein [Flavobacteriales bacterium]
MRALDANGNLTAWNPARTIAFALALDANSVYAGGLFTNIGGQARNRIAAINKATGLATGWNPNANGSEVAALAVLGSTVYAGGDFSTIGGQTRNRIAALMLPPDSLPHGIRSVATRCGRYRQLPPWCTHPVSLPPLAGNTQSYRSARSHYRLATAWNPNANNAVLGMSLSGGTCMPRAFLPRSVGKRAIVSLH